MYASTVTLGSCLFSNGEEITPCFIELHLLLFALLMIAMRDVLCRRLSFIIETDIHVLKHSYRIHYRKSLLMMMMEVYF